MSEDITEGIQISYDPDREDSDEDNSDEKKF